MRYDVRVEHYYNRKDGDRYNVSFLPARNNASGGSRERSEGDETRDESNIHAAIRAIRAIGFANTWDYFVTFTLDPEKRDRTDMRGNAKVMFQYFRDLRKRGYELEYLIVPEMHSDHKNFHYHGLMRVSDSLLDIHPQSYLPDKRGHKIFPGVHERFGFTDLSPVRDNAQFVLIYCTKYITKDAFATAKNNGMHLFYASQGIKRPDLIYKQTQVNMSPSYFAQFGSVDYYPDYCVGCASGIQSSELLSILSCCLPEKNLDQVYNRVEKIRLCDPDVMLGREDVGHVPEEFDYSIFGG